MLKAPDGASAAGRGADGSSRATDGLTSANDSAGGLQNASDELPRGREGGTVEHDAGTSDVPEHSGSDENPDLLGSVDDHVGEIPRLLQSVDDTIGGALDGIRRWGPEDQARFEEFFGRRTFSDRLLDSIGVPSPSGTRRDAVQQMLERMKQEMRPGSIELRDLDPSVADPETTYAYVNPRPPQSGARQIYVGRLFWEQAEVGPNNRIGTLVHELSHFSDIGGSRDFIYGVDEAREFSKIRPDLAWMNADSIQYYVEQYLDGARGSGGVNGNPGGRNEG